MLHGHNREAHAINYMVMITVNTTCGLTKKGLCVSKAEVNGRVRLVLRFLPG